MEENQAPHQQTNLGRKRKKNKKIRRKRSLHKKKKRSEIEDFINYSSKDHRNEDNDSDSILEVTPDQENIEDWPVSMLKTAEQHEEESYQVITYKTGTKIDQLFPEGIKSKEIIELCGPHQCGKTKMATSIAISLLLNYKEKHAVYIYTNNDFHESNVRKITLSRGLKEEAVKDVLSRMQLMPIDDTTDLIEALNEISDPSEMETFSFLFIDSITIPFFHAKVSDADLNSIMISKVHEFLFKIAKTQNKTIFVTNLALNACTHPIDSDEEVKSEKSSLSNNTPSTHEMIVKHDGSESESYDSKANVIKPALGSHWSEILDHRYIISSVDREDSDNEELVFLDEKRKVTYLRMNEDHCDPTKAVIIKLGDIGAV